MQINAEVLIYIAGFLLVLLFLRVLRKPLAVIFRVLLQLALGGILLLLANTLGLRLAVNPVTALVAGTLGLPGVAALWVLTLFI